MLTLLGPVALSQTPPDPPAFFRRLNTSTYNVFIDKRGTQAKLPARFRGVAPRIASGDFGKWDSDAGPDVPCGVVMPKALIARAAMREQSANGRVTYRFNPSPDVAKYFIVDRQNKVVEWILFFWNDEGTAFTKLYRRSLAIYSKPCLAQSIHWSGGSVYAAWGFSQKARILLLWGKNANGRPRTFLSYSLKPPVPDSTR